MSLNDELGTAFQSPMFNTGIGMLAASGPSLKPVGFGQALAGGMQMAQQQQAQQQHSAYMQALMQAQQQKQQAAQATLERQQHDRALLFGGAQPPSNAPTDAPALNASNGTPGQSYTDPMHHVNPQAQAFLQSPQARAMYDSDPGQFWKQYGTLANPQHKMTYQHVGNTLLGINPTDPLHPQVVYRGPNDPTGGLNLPSWMTPQQKHDAQMIHFGLKPRASVNDEPADPEVVDEYKWQYILNGPSALSKLGRGSKTTRQAIIKAASQFAQKNGVSLADLATRPGRQKALQSSLTNLQKRSDVMHASENSFQNNAHALMQVSSQLGRNASPVINKWILGTKEALGDPQVAAFNTAINAAAMDYARIMNGSTGAAGVSVNSVEDAKRLIRRELSHKSLGAVIDMMNTDIANQQQGTSKQLSFIKHAMGQFGNAPNAEQPQQPAGNVDDLLKKYGVQ